MLRILPRVKTEGELNFVFPESQLSPFSDNLKCLIWSHIKFHIYILSILLVLVLCYSYVFITIVLRYILKSDKKKSFLPVFSCHFLLDDCIKYILKSFCHVLKQNKIKSKQNPIGALTEKSLNSQITFSSNIAFSYSRTFCFQLFSYFCMFLYCVFYFSLLSS